MSKRQSRRTISVSRPIYDAAKRIASARNQSLAHFTAEALRLAGVEAPETGHFTPPSPHPRKVTQS